MFEITEPQGCGVWAGGAQNHAIEDYGIRRLLGAIVLQAFDDLSNPKLPAEQRLQALFWLALGDAEEICWLLGLPDPAVIIGENRLINARRRGKQKNEKYNFATT